MKEKELKEYVEMCTKKNLEIKKWQDKIEKNDEKKMVLKYIDKMLELMQKDRHEMSCAIISLIQVRKFITDNNTKKKKIIKELED